MSYREKEIVTLTDKNFSIIHLVQLYENGNIRFLQKIKEKVTEKNIVTDLIEAIQQGIPMPVVYVSELQNGDFLILGSEDRLLCLLEYVRGSFPVFIDDISKKHKCHFYDLEEINPWLSAMILRTVFMFRIIDFQTPKYLHMEVGLFHERWKVSREQAVRTVSIMEPINPFHAKLKDKDIRYRAKMLGLCICLCDQFPDEVAFDILYDNKTKRKIKTMKLTMKNINELIFL